MAEKSVHLSNIIQETLLFDVYEVQKHLQYLQYALLVRYNMNLMPDKNHRI